MGGGNSKALRDSKVEGGGRGRGEGRGRRRGEEEPLGFSRGL